MDSLRLPIPAVADPGDLLPDYYRVAWAPGEDGYVYGADFLASAPDYSSVLLALSARCWVASVLLRLPVSSFPAIPSLDESVMALNVAVYWSVSLTRVAGSSQVIGALPSGFECCRH